MLLVDEQWRLSGILTDGDIRRLLLKYRGTDLLAEAVRDLMTTDSKHVHLGELASQALAVCNRYRIDELPVLDDRDRPVGVIDVQDLLGIKRLSHG